MRVQDQEHSVRDLHGPKEGALAGILWDLLVHPVLVVGIGTDLKKSPANPGTEKTGSPGLGIYMIYDDIWIYGFTQLVQESNKKKT